MRIGELAKRAGVNLQTIRFYERRGLLRKPARTASGYRDYAASDVESLAFIQWCKRLGFTLKEVRPLLALHGAVARVPAKRSPDLTSILRIAQEKIADIEERQKSLDEMKRQLARAIEQLTSDAGPVCPAAKRTSPRRAPGPGKCPF
ncbi:MAG TPA: heavy metal-responsive transcriptional regulator [Candidatus Acidoferrum sp.]|nr:heavy metal-responsive transcriptional regulator [Candidatus Acidoferrum sp.]